MDDLVKELRAPMWRLEPPDIQGVVARAATRIEALTGTLRECVEALRPFQEATITPLGNIIGMERWHFDQARTTLTRAKEMIGE